MLIFTSLIALMSNWLSKSNQSFTIADDTKSEMLNNRVHCYYYGCVQLMKHTVLNNFASMTIEKLDLECNRKEKPENGGTHQYLKVVIKNDLNEKKERIKGTDFNSQILNLHHLRTKADYSIDDITEEDLVLAQKYTRGITSTISSHYKI